MAKITLDEDVLRGELEDEGLISSAGLDHAGCPPWLTKWILNAWFALDHEKREQAKTD